MAKLEGLVIKRPTKRDPRKVFVNYAHGSLLSIFTYIGGDRKENRAHAVWVDGDGEVRNDDLTVGEWVACSLNLVAVDRYADLLRGY